VSGFEILREMGFIGLLNMGYWDFRALECRLVDFLGSNMAFSTFLFFRMPNFTYFAFFVL